MQCNSFPVVFVSTVHMKDNLPVNDSSVYNFQDGASLLCVG